jgi:GDP-L-fucose synthase
MQKEKKIYIAGHNGMVGSALFRNLKSKGYSRFVTRSLDELDLTRQDDVDKFFQQEKPSYVFLAAAKVGGIVANNTYRAEFLYDNLMIQNNVIHASWKHGVEKLLFLGSSCIYPKLAAQPLREDSLLTGTLEYTNEPYAIAKIAGIKMCESYYKQYGSDFISVMPTNLYGPNDNYDLEKSHVLPALIRKMHLGKCLLSDDWDGVRADLKRNPIQGMDFGSGKELIISTLAKFGITLVYHEGLSPEVSVNLWGSGNVYREFLHVEDMADACVFMMENISAKKLYSDLGKTHINIGTGEDLTIRKLAEIVRDIVGFKGEINWDKTKPDGTPRKQLDVSLLNSLNWNHRINLSEGINMVYQNYIR